MNNLWSRKIPTFIGLFFIIVGTLVTTLLVRGDTIFQIRAGPGEDPKNIKITNVSDNSFTITYQTDDKVIGTVNYGIDSNNLDGISLDDRDQLSQQINKYNYHSITIRNLDPNTKYYYSITSGSKKYENTKSRFEVLTKGEISDTPSSQFPISGKVVLPDGTAPNDGVVYVEIEGAELTSTLLKNDGTYVLPLNTLRKSLVDEYFELSDNTLITVDIYANSQFSTASVTKNEISPVPLITLSGSYDFSKRNEDSAENTNEGASFPQFGQRGSQGGASDNTTQTPTPSPSLSPIPSNSLSPTSSPSPSATQTPTPSVSEMSPVPTLPPTGNSSVIIASIFGFITAFFGLATLFLIRGKKYI